MKLNAKRFIAAALSSVMIFSSFAVNQVFADENTSISADGGTIDLAAVKMTVNAGGWKESVYAEWLPVDGTYKYEVYIKKSSEDDSAYKQLDDELIRQYPTYWRADAVGLAAGEYDLKIVSKDSIGQELAWSEQKGIDVINYNRTGFAFSNQSTYKSSSGAYNNDGTLKDGAIVLYVTKDTAKTVTADIITTSKGGTTSYTGLQAIMSGLEKGYETRPIDVRIIGTINAADMDSFGSSSEGLQIKGKAYTNINLTLEGIGNDATIRGFGFLLRGVANVEFRNFAIMNCMDDSVSMDTDNCNLWIHNLDIFYGQKGSASDQVKGDGTLDIKEASTWTTFSENHIWDCGKTSLCGMKNDSYKDYRVTYVGNWFDHSDSRHPRIRGGNIHIYNNYFDGNSKYGVGVTTGGSAFVENNYFRSVKYPMLVSLQGSDAIGGGTFSGEDSGYIKEYGNVIAGKYSFITGEDAYSASSRDEKVPDTYVAKKVTSGVRYSNFDTDSTMYSYTPIAASNVPTYVVSNAGRLNHGDFTWDFDNETEDTNYDVIPGLRTAIENYTSKLVSVGGTVKGTQSGGTPSSLTGIDGNVVSYQPEAKLEGLNLPNTTEESKITAGNPANLGDGATESLTYDLKLETADLDGSTVSAEKTITGSPGEFTIIPKTSTATGSDVTLDKSKGIKLNGTGSVSTRAIKFTATDKGVLYLSADSNSSDSPNRLIRVTDGSGNTITDGEFKTPLSKNAVSLPDAGTYYIYSTESGINVSFIGVIYGDTAVPDKPVYDNTPGFTYTAVAPAPAIAFSKPSVPKSVVDADGEVITPVNPTETTTENTTNDSDNSVDDSETSSETTSEDSENSSETTSEEEPDTVIYYGDVNGDNVLEINDAVQLLSYILDKTNFLESVDFNADLADVDGNDVIDAIDASLVLEKCLKGSAFRFPNGRDWNYEEDTEKQPEQTSESDKEDTSDSENSSEDNTAASEDTSEDNTETSEDASEDNTASGTDSPGVSSGEWAAADSIPDWLTLTGATAGTGSTSYTVFDGIANNSKASLYKIEANSTITIQLTEAAVVEVYIAADATSDKDAATATLDGESIGETYKLPSRKGTATTPFIITTTKGGKLEITNSYAALLFKIVVKNP